MGTSGPAEKPRYDHLSDEQLIELLPASDEEKYRQRTTPEEEQLFEESPERFIKPEAKVILEELWSRLYPPMASKARSKLWAICPRQHGDPDGFVRQSVNEAYFAFLRRIKKQEYGNFPGYVYTLFLNVGRDEARKITGKRGPAGEEDDDRGVVRPKLVALDDAGEVVSQGMGPLQKLTEAELKGTIIAILREHAEEHPTSAHTLVLHGAEGQTWEQVADAVLPSEAVEGSLEARKGRVRRLFTENRAEVAPKLEKYGITSEHVFHWKEAGVGAGTETDDE